jgi:mRNA interferase RelE/StbE
MYQVIVAPRARKEIKSLAKIYKKAIIEAIDDLAENPFLGKPLTRELTGKYLYRIGVYRLIYTIRKRDKKVFILTAGHRGKIYQ